MSDETRALTQRMASQHRIITLLGVWAGGRGPLYRRLAQAFEHALRTGELPTGFRLPSERELARVLGISRSTVVGAYDELFAAGWVERRQGSGTHVSGQTAIRSGQAHAAQIQTLGYGPGVDTFLATDLTSVDLATGTVRWPVGLSTSGLDLSASDHASLLVGHGYFPQGIQPLRAAVAAYYSRGGLPTTPEQILITTGAQQAISLIATLLVQRGDTVVMEMPTYYGALDAFRATGARLVSLPVAPDGIRMEFLRPRFAAHPGSVCYLQPTYHNPTGTTLPDAARRTLVSMAQEYDVTLIEDLTMADLPLTTSRFQPPLPLAAYSAHARGAGDANATPDEDTAQDGMMRPPPSVITIGSLSKVIWGGLRVGWIRAMPSVIARLARLKAVTDLGSPVLSQLQAVHLLDNLEQIRELRHNESLRQLEHMTTLLRTALPEWKWRHPDGGLFLWTRIPGGDASILSQAAQRVGVVLMPGTTLTADTTCGAYVRLAFTRPPAEVALGVERLAIAWTQAKRQGAVSSPVPPTL